MAKTKVNPRWRPINQADINRAAKKTRDTAMRLTATLFLTVLLDKEEANAEIIQRVWEEMNDLADSVDKGYVNVSDLADTLKKEYGINI